VAGSPSRSPPVVLIVEDDPLLRMLAVEVVEEAGFVALEAGNADEAVALLESRPDISLLFTDIDIPGCGLPKWTLRNSRARSSICALTRATPCRMGGV
jgi:CheY-like chemotaxis protein